MPDKAGTRWDLFITPAVLSSNLYPLTVKVHLLLFRWAHRSGESRVYYESAWKLRTRLLKVLPEGSEVSLWTVRDALRQLTAAGLLECDRHSGRANLYRLVLSADERVLRGLTSKNATFKGRAQGTPKARNTSDELKKTVIATDYADLELELDDPLSMLGAAEPGAAQNDDLELEDAYDAW